MPECFYLKKDLIINCLAMKKKWEWFYKAIIAAICIIATMLMMDTHRAYGQVEIKDIEALGTAIIYKTDVETAKQQAIESGLVSALDKAIAEILPVEVVTHNFQAINKIIYNDTDKYISDYKVLTEAVSDKSYRVLIQAKVSIKKLKNRLTNSGLMRVGKINIQNIEIIVQGTRNLSSFISFRKGLKEIPGVKEIQVSDMQPDEAKLLVNFEGNAKEFTDALVLKKFDKFSIRIFEMSENKLKTELIPR